MGFTWIFGFVAGLTDIDALFYLFIVANSLQGVYICCSFALSGRVRGMYKRKFGFEDDRSTTSNSTEGLQMSNSRL